MGMKNKQRIVRGMIIAAALCPCSGAKAIAGGQGGSVSAKTESPFYCNIKALTLEERHRHKEIGEKLNAARVEAKELADGYALRLRPGMISLVELADWVDAERKCCPFLGLAIEAERENGPTWLKITGREGVKQFIRMEFKDLTAAS